MAWSFHLSVSPEPGLRDGDATRSLCGKAIENVALIFFGEENIDPKQSQRLCRHCREIAATRELHYEFGVYGAGKKVA